LIAFRQFLLEGKEETVPELSRNTSQNPHQYRIFYGVFLSIIAGSDGVEQRLPLPVLLLAQG
jgi:hypothetical protein